MKFSRKMQKMLDVQITRSIKLDTIRLPRIEDKDQQQASDTPDGSDAHRPK